MVKKFANIFIRFDRIHERDRRTDKRTDRLRRMTTTRPRLHSIARQKASKVSKMKGQGEFKSVLIIFESVLMLFTQICPK